MASHGWLISDDEESSDDESLLTQERHGATSQGSGLCHKHLPNKRFRCPLSIKANKEKVPVCPYGEQCYRKNPDHFAAYRHPPKSKEHGLAVKKRKIVRESKDPQMVWHESSPLNFLLTRVTGIPSQYNYYNESSPLCSLHISDILGEDFGDLTETVQFNYCIDPSWFMDQLPKAKRGIPVTFVHGESGMDFAELRTVKSKCSNVKSCRVDLPPFGTHHTKMMFLKYDAGIRIIIHTANLVEKDWHQKTQGMWLSPLFPPASGQGEKGSAFSFKEDLLEYISTYNKPNLNCWCDIIRSHDLTSAKVVLVGSVPGRHKGMEMHKWGHPKLAKALTAYTKSDIAGWHVVGQFSSIGSLGTDKDKWLCGEWLRNLSAHQKKSGLGTLQKPSLKLIFPSAEDIRTSLEGYPAGASVPYSFSVAKKQQWLNAFFHRWKAGHLGRSSASPHIKSYARVSKDFTQVAWFLLTSANLSKAAWGSFEKKETQLAIRSYELGVLFLPRRFSAFDTFAIKGSGSAATSLTLPYATPLTEYSSSDRPWVWDVPHIDLPDRNGNMWCPS